MGISNSATMQYAHCFEKISQRIFAICGMHLKCKHFVIVTQDSWPGTRTENNVDLQLKDLLRLKTFVSCSLSMKPFPSHLTLLAEVIKDWRYLWHFT